MKKIIKIRNLKDEKKFYRRLPFYRTILFRFVYFELEIDNEKYLPIIKALNVKHRRERIDYIYNFACNQVDQFYKNRDLCQFKGSRCFLQRKADFGYNGCCRACKYQNCNGCPTNNLACKLFYCATVKNGQEIIKFNDLLVLKVLSLRNRILLKSEYFSNSKDIQNDLYYGSLIVGTFRICFRVLPYFLSNLKTCHHDSVEQENESS